MGHLPFTHEIVEERLHQPMPILGDLLAGGGVHRVLEQEQLLDQRLWKYDFPVITHMDFSHYSPMIAMPLGVRARVDTTTVSMSLLGSSAR